MIKILLCGVSGAMGKTLLEIVKDSDEFEVVAGIALENLDLGFNVYQSFDDVKEEIDVVIDYSSPNLIEKILNFCKSKKLPLVIATTGLSDENMSLIAQASKQIAIVQSGNYSIGINVLEKCAKLLSQLLIDYDIEILEKHHNKKKDAPSGTAKMLFDAVNEGRNKSLEKNVGRRGISEGRKSNEVGISSIRAGSIVGEHEVIFSAGDETITIKHQAQSKKIFANGSLKAAKFVISKENGKYNMEDVLEN